MDGMRYERGGKGKYWIPKPQTANSRTPLLANDGSSRPPAPEARGKAHEYRATDPDWEIGVDAEDERLFTNARALEFGDWNYPVVTAHEARREDWLHRTPGLLTTSTNRNLFQPTRDNKARRRSEIRQSIQKGKKRSTSPSKDTVEPRAQEGSIETKLKRDRSRSPSASGRSDRSQIVDLIVEDSEAEEAERVRARKEGGDAWNHSPQRHFVRTYSIDDDAPEGQEIRRGWEPSQVPSTQPPEHAVSEDEEEDNDEDADGGQDGANGQGSSKSGAEGRFGSLIEEDNVWGGSGN